MGERARGAGLVGAIAGFVLAIVTIFRKQWAPITAPLYAFAEGLFLGGISVVLEDAYPGIVIPAISLTIGIFVAFLLIYRSHLIRVTDKLRIAVVAATGAVALVYLVSLALNLVGVHVSYLNEAIAGSGVLGIGVNVLVIGIAAFNLLLDFDLIERGVAARAPKYMKWCGLRVTRDSRVAVHRDPPAPLEASPPLSPGIRALVFEFFSVVGLAHSPAG